MALGYNVPQKLVSKVGIKALRVYTSVNDAFILFSEYRNKYKGIDPESIVSSTGSTNNRPNIGVDTPASYSMVFGLNMTL
ncbi:hypothetical protein D3C86_1035160 [compost metagenome]